VILDDDRAIADVVIGSTAERANWWRGRTREMRRWIRGGWLLLLESCGDRLRHQRRHRLNEVRKRGRIRRTCNGCGSSDDRGHIVAATCREDKRRSGLDVVESVAVLGDNIGLREFEAMGYTPSNLQRETVEVTTATFTFGDVVVSLQVGGDRDKGAMVTSEVLTGHVRARLGALLKDVEIMERVTPRVVEMGVESADLVAERG
jgi:hypothetical protein